MYSLKVLDTTKSDCEAIGVLEQGHLEAKHQVLYVFYNGLFNFYTSKIFSTLFFDFIDLISTLKNLKTRNFRNF